MWWSATTSRSSPIRYDPSYGTVWLTFGRADVMLISVAEYESMRETLDLLSDSEALEDLRQSREDFASGDTFSADEVLTEMERRQRRAA